MFCTLFVRAVIRELGNIQVYTIFNIFTILWDNKISKALLILLFLEWRSCLSQSAHYIEIKNVN